MNRVAIIATHHKAGTLWMNTTFSAIARALQLPHRKLQKEQAISPNDMNPPLILFELHSNFGAFPWLKDNPENRLLHLIRDPRDVIISAMHYHRVSRERQLHKPRRKFGGATYQVALNALDNDHDRYLFEMKNTSANVIEAMRRWDYSQPNCFECRYEELIRDEEMVLVTKILCHLGFAEDELEIGRKQFWRKSLFGKRAKKIGRSQHVRAGEARQWTRVFDQELAGQFLQNFGNVLILLGYERDDSWVARLPRSILRETDNAV
jgi:hypothetical protein